MPGRVGFHAGQQLGREQLGKQHEVALVVGRRVEEELALLGEFVEAVDRLASGTARRRCESVRRRGESAAWHPERSPGSSIPETLRSRRSRCRTGSSWGSSP